MFRHWFTLLGSSGCTPPCLVGGTPSFRSCIPWSGIVAGFYTLSQVLVTLSGDGHTPLQLWCGSHILPRCGWLPLMLLPTAGCLARASPFIIVSILYIWIDSALFTCQWFPSLDVFSVSPHLCAAHFDMVSEHCSCSWGDSSLESCSLSWRHTFGDKDWYADDVSWRLSCLQSWKTHKISILW